jgi:hypothetical protein
VNPVILGRCPHRDLLLSVVVLLLQVFNGIVPKLLKQPVSSAGLRAIGQLAGTAGEQHQMARHLIPAGT